jgi:peptidoglycan/LPS O-acetylase OafA/YrhL
MATDSRFHLPELDIVRLIAFVTVYLHHFRAFYAQKPGWGKEAEYACGAGMQLFFLLSSYLITELLLRELEKTRTVHVRAFFARRILRIWPLYFVFLGACFALSKTTKLTVLTTPQLLALIFFWGNWWVVQYGFLTTFASPLWSISLEEQYYIIWPFIARTGKRGILAVCLCLLVLSNGTLWYLGTHNTPRPSVWCNSFVEFQFFAIGGILALALHRRKFAMYGWFRPILFVCAAAIVFFAQVRFRIAANAILGPRDLIPGYAFFGVGVVLIFLSFYGAKLPRGSAPFIYLGRISYGLYVFHELAIVIAVAFGAQFHWPIAVKVAAALALCVGLAAFSYRYLETPFLRLKSRFTFILSQPSQTPASPPFAPRIDKC